MSPYQIPFNFEILDQKLKMQPQNKFAYREYMLPDKKTFVTMDIGKTEKEIMRELIKLYSDSSLLNLEPWKYFKQAEPAEILQAGSREIQKQSTVNESKGLAYRIMQTIDQYVVDESIDPANVNNILLTGGSFKLKSHDSKRSLLYELEKALQKKPFSDKYKQACIIKCEEPQYGSILNGARILFSMPEFDQHFCVTRKEWLFDDQIVTKKLF